MKNIYTRTQTKLHEVLKTMIINPKYIEINNNGAITKYNYSTNKEYLIEHYSRKITLIKNMNYNPATDILKIEI